MICEYCYGKNPICPNCQGSGILSCCDGAVGEITNQIEWSLWHFGVVLHPYLDHTATPLISWHDLGMRLP